MSSYVWRVTPQITARHALALMASHAISGVVVVDGARPVGVFTERDVVRLVAGGIDLANLPVSDVMTRTVVTIPASAAPNHAIELMRNQEVRRLLVVDAEGAMAGMLTQTDLSRVFERHQAVLVDQLVSTAPVNALGYSEGLH